MPEYQGNGVNGGDSGHTQGGRARLVEDILIILCILSLWPTILRWRHAAFEYVLYAALICLVVILYRRVQRFREARDELDRS